jgi:Na+/proline symporter
MIGSVPTLLAANRPWFAIIALHDKATIFAVITGYLLMLIIVGLVFRKFSADTSDYFRAGGKATWWLIGGSVFMQAFSAWTFTGAAGAAFQVGWSLPLMFISNAVGFLTIAAITGPWFRQLRCVTGADLVRLRFGAPMEQFTAYLNLMMGPIFGGVQLYGLAIFASVLLGVNIYYTIIVLGFVVLFYAGISGAWAVMAADFIKALVLIPITLLLAVICLRELGGITGLLAAIHRAGLSADYAPVKTREVLATIKGINPSWFTWTFFLAWYGNNLLVANSLNNGGRYLSAKDGREARRAALLAAGLFFLGLLIWFVPPMTARLLIADDVMAMPLPKPAEGAYAAISIHLLPDGLVALVLVGMCAATMSSLDVSLNSLAGNITQNIYPAACRALGVTPWEGRARLILAKFVTLFCATAVVACGLAMARYGRGGVFNILMDVMATIAAPIAVPMVLGLFLRRVPPAAPFVSIGAGLCVSIPIYLAPLVLGTTPWPFQSQVGTVVAVSLGSFLAVRAFFRPDEAALAREREFFSRRNRPVDFAAEIGPANDGRQLRIVGAFGTALGLAILLLLLPASSAGHAGKICAVATSTFSIGGLMIWVGRGRSRDRDHYSPHPPSK